MKELQTNLYKDITPNNHNINKDFASLSSPLEVLVVHAPKKLEVHKVKEAKIDFSKSSATEIKVKRKRGYEDLIIIIKNIIIDYFVGESQKVLLHQ